MGDEAIPFFKTRLLRRIMSKIAPRNDNIKAYPVYIVLGFMCFYSCLKLILIPSTALRLPLMGR